MSRQNRRFLAVAGLAAALTLGLPSPSRAAGLWKVTAPATLVVRAWSWLESLGLGVRWEKQGSAIDPNGSTARVTTRPPASDVPLEQGSAIDPNGLK
ncbi:MAG TPA: hypothetical protein VG477_13275 [Thermoanaerobaculia bacterium]|nr:hypothetical protein [Thermoanaerobaculia bacterium]